jgi:hypothetical protein
LDQGVGELHLLGFGMSKKSLLGPGQLLHHLGFDTRLSDCTLRIPQKKVMAFKELAAQHLCSRYQASRELLAGVIGKLGSFQLGCTGAMVLTRGLMRCLDQLPREQQGQVGTSGEVEVWEWRDYSGEVELSPLEVEDRRFWLASI